MSKLVLTVSLFIILLSCRLDKADIAKDRAFYFSVNSPSESASNLLIYLSKNLNNKRIAITNQSGQNWPFYEVLAPNKELPIDSLMPPHSFVHLLKEKNQSDIHLGEYYLEIKVMIRADTLPNYELDIYRMDSLGLKLSAKTGIHYTEMKPESELYDFLLKSIIRYSFK